MKPRVVIVLITAFLIGTIVGALGYWGWVSREVESRHPGNVWGVPYKTIQCAVQPTQTGYILGQPIDVVIHTRNLGKGDAKSPIPSVGGYRLALFDAQGIPVQPTSKGIDLDNAFGSAKSHAAVVVIPSRESETTLTINQYFVIPRPGAYALVVMRAVDTGFAVSNMAMIYIKKAPFFPPKKAFP